MVYINAKPVKVYLNYDTVKHFYSQFTIQLFADLNFRVVDYIAAAKMSLQ